MVSNILIGGTGFIGTALSTALAERGERVVSISRHGRHESISGVLDECCDIADVRRLSSIVDRGTDIFVLTGQVGPDFDSGNEMKNLGGIAGVLAKSTGKRIFYVSSAFVYGNTDIPAEESFPCNPIEPYSIFKLESERLLQTLLSQHRLVVFRVSNVYGSPKNRGIIGLLLKNLFESDGGIVRINGDGSQTRDYVFLDDVIEAMVAVKETSCDFGSDTVNISFGRSFSVLDIIKSIEEISDKKLRYEITNVFLDEIRDMHVSNEKLGRKYAYKPKTSLRVGLQKTIARYREAYRELKNKPSSPEKRV